MGQDGWGEWRGDGAKGEESWQTPPGEQKPKNNLVCPKRKLFRVEINGVGLELEGSGLILSIGQKKSTLGLSHP